MYRKEIYKAYLHKLEVLANHHRKMTFSIMMAVLIGSFAFVRYKVHTNRVIEAAHPIELMSSVKQSTSLSIASQLGDLVEYFGDLEDLDKLSKKQELTLEDSVKIESIKKKLFDQDYEKN